MSGGRSGWRLGSCAVVAMVLSASACTDGDPDPVVQADPGPLALHTGRLSGQEAGLEGELVIDDRCVFVRLPGEDRLVFVVWPAQNVAWDDGALVFASPALGRVVLEDGDLVSLGGGAESEREGGVTFEQWIARSEWVVEPDPSCGEEAAIWWTAGDLVRRP